MGLRLTMLTALLCSSLAFAGRSLPNDMDMAVLKQVNYPQVVLSIDGISWLKVLTLGWLSNNTSLEVSSGVRVRNEKNRFVTRNKLYGYVGKPIGIRRNKENNIEEIWILTDEERETFRRRVQ